ncbi:hypothetical protein [Qipengyuania atrilutea]|uniref:Antifreeze protein n=1 Tax=Qipengyuania atrilutea TaxID=2744473 RepID=A0A850H1H2_9SPHN|nr:hypothetical protein [Actirhodobacter atriluteus]NVD45824.1 hypothetical protein [Actirhodobacter atriluteus]
MARTIKQTGGSYDYAEWNAFALQSWSLWADASAVMMLRTMRLLGGGKLAEREAQTMVSEKFAAFSEAAMGLTLAGPLSAASAREALKPYERRVRANRRRLGQHKKPSA